MARLMTNEVGVQITWTGKSKKGERKQKMELLKKIFESICGAVRKRDELKTSCDPDIKHYVCEWLRHATDRIQDEVTLDNTKYGVCAKSMIF